MAIVQNIVNKNRVSVLYDTALPVAADRSTAHTRHDHNHYITPAHRF